MKKKTISVVIPAAGSARRMAGVLAAESWGLPKALLEVGRRPAIVEILEGIEGRAAAAGWTPHYRVVTGANGAKLRRFLKAFYAGTPIAKRLKFFSQPRPTGPLSGVLSARTLPGPALIWLCDTLVLGALPGFAGDVVFTGAVEGDLSRWCLALANGHGRLKALLDKPAGARGLGQALIGVYGVEDAPLFWRLGREVIRRRQKLSGEYQLSSALKAYHLRRPLSLRSVSGWYDTGSPETFLKAKERCLERLDGHHIAIDFKAGRVRKRLSGGAVEKDLGLEAAWFRKIVKENPALRGSVPEKVSYLKAGLSLPYKDWPSLTDWFLYRSYYLPAESEAAFNGFLSFVRDRLHRRADVAAGGAFAANWSMLVEKTEERLSRVQAQGLLKRRFTLNGRPLASWAEQRPKFLALAARYSKSADSDWRSIHGDLVFSNVLADGRGGYFLVDPRGSYGGPAGVSGDRYYDYAKIAQCVLSNYDSLKKDEFVLRAAGGRHELELPRAGAPGRRRWRSAFLRFCRDERLDLGRLRFFEAAMLLSLLPLHPEKPEQVLAAYLSGLRLLSELS